MRAVVLLWLVLGLGRFSSASLLLEDPSGDDYGAGAFRYPLEASFQAGVLDLRGLELEETAAGTQFTVWLSRLANPWEAPLGFSHPLIQLYLDLAAGGRTDLLLPATRLFSRLAPATDAERSCPGQEVVGLEVGAGGQVSCVLEAPLALASGWEVAVVLSGFEAYSVGPAGSQPQPVSVTVVDDVGRDLGRGVRFSLPLGPPAPDWGYYVLVSPLDLFGPGRLRPWAVTAGAYVSAGGNVADVLDSSEHQQVAMLQAGQLAPIREPLAPAQRLWPWLAAGGAALLALGFVAQGVRW
ncbi:MAG: hypothetical protein HY335_00100 [Deinococcus sp.]|nr:hypothetical protein [Deinococcus sp.]